VKLEWQPRCEPLQPGGVWAQGGAARKLALRLLESQPLANSLRGCSAQGQLVLLGPAELLGWVEGAIYLGCDAYCSSLYLPTLWRPSLPLDWLCSRLAHLGPPPWLLLPPPETVVMSLAGLGVVESDSLKAFAAGR